VFRVVDAALTGEPAPRPAGFDLAAFWRGWCAAFERDRPEYPVVLRVAPGAVPRLARVLGEGVRASAAAGGRPDAAGRLVLPLTFEDAEAACALVLSLGDAVEVLAPPELRRRVARTAAALATRYAGETPDARLGG
jgi:predicted DNA-binding transcriptional regulator YafY